MLEGGRFSNSPRVERLRGPTDILAIDIGSSKASLSLLRPSTLKFTEFSRDPWVNYDLITENLGKTKIKWIDGNIFQMRIAAKIVEMVQETDFRQIHEIALTGLSNSLAVRNGQTGETKVIMDEPSLVTELTSGQREILEGYGLNESLKIQSALMKLLSLKNHGEYVEKLFGTGTKFEDLQFGTLMSLLTEGFGGNLNQIPQADFRAFAANTGISDGIILNNLLFDLGLPVFDFKKDNQTQGHYAEVTIVNDLDAEVAVMESLYGTRTLKPEDIVISTDTVGKVISKKAGRGQNGKWKKTGNLNYCSQRNGLGGIHQTWFCDILHIENNGQIYQVVADMLAELVKIQSDSYFYNPDGGSGNNGGTLYEQEEGQLVEMTRQKVMSLPVAEKRVIMAAILKGAAYGLIAKAEEAWDEDSPDESKRLMIYGGLANKRPTWQTFLAEVSPFEVSNIKIPSGAEAAAIMVGRSLGNMDGFTIPNPQVIEVDVSPDRVAERRQEYLMWKQRYDKLIQKEH